MLASAVLGAEDALPLPADAQKLMDAAGKQELLLQQELKAKIAKLRQDLVTTLRHADEQALQGLEISTSTSIEEKIEALEGVRPASPNGPSPSPASDTGPAGTVVIAIACAGAALGAFLADQDFTGGNPGHFNEAVRTAGVAHAAPEQVYRDERFGADMVYAIPGLVPGAHYAVRPHFAENWVTDPGQRVFDVLINGTVVLKQLDILAAAGGQHIALVREVPATASASGQLAISFAAVVQNPKLNGLEIIRAAP
jgi:hypothetical protein